MEKKFSEDEAFTPQDVAESLDSVQSVEQEETAEMMDIAAGLSGLDPRDPANALALSGIVQGIRSALEDAESEPGRPVPKEATDPLDRQTADLLPIQEYREKSALEQQGLRDLHALLDLREDILPEQLS